MSCSLTPGPFPRGDENRALLAVGSITLNSTVCWTQAQNPATRFTSLHWRQQEMENWLVSDLNPPSLVSFSQILQKMM